MADSVREQIIQAAVIAIDAAVSTATVYRSREAALATDQLPAVVVAPLNDTPSERATSLCWLDWAFQLAVDVVTGDELDKAADPILQAAHAALMGGTRDLGLAAVHEIMPGPVSFSASNREQPVGLVRAVFTISYRTKHGDLTVAP
jgi:hypothetical protein